MDRKILVVTGDGGEAYEVLYAVHRFQEAGFVPVLAAPSKRRLNLVMHDFEPGWDTYMERPGYCREADIAITDARSGDYEAVFLVGGRAPEYLRNDARLRGLVREFQEQAKWIFSICHGIQIITAAGLAKGRNLTCYEHVRSEVEACGGTFVAKPCVRDGNMVSAQTWQDHPWLFREVFNCLGEGQVTSFEVAGRWSGQTICGVNALLPLRPGRRWLAVLDAVAWPGVVLLFLSRIPGQAGLVAPIACVIRGANALLRLQTALWENHRYRFMTWRGARVLLVLLFIAAALKVGLAWRKITNAHVDPTVQ